MLPISLKNKFKTKLTLKLNNREKTLGIIFISLLFAFLYYTNVYAKQIQQVKALAAEKEQKQALIMDYQQRGYDNVAALKKEKRQIETEFGELHKEVPGYVGEPEILVGIDDMINSFNLSSDKISFHQYQEEEGFGRLPVSFIVKGPQVNIYNFIEQLEKNERPVRVAAVEFTPADAYWVTCNITADFYVLGTPMQDPDDYDFFSEVAYGESPSYGIFRYIDNSVDSDWTDNDYNDYYNESDITTKPVDEPEQYEQVIASGYTRGSHSLTPKDEQRLMNYSSEGYSLIKDEEYKEYSSLISKAVKVSKDYMQLKENYDYRDLATQDGKKEYKEELLKYVENEKLVEEQIEYILQNKLIKKSVFVTKNSLMFKNKDNYITIRGVEYFYFHNKEKEALKGINLGAEYKRDVEITFKPYDYFSKLTDRYLAPVFLVE